MQRANGKNTSGWIEDMVLSLKWVNYRMGFITLILKLFAYQYLVSYVKMCVLNISNPVCVALV